MMVLTNTQFGGEVGAVGEGRPAEALRGLRQRMIRELESFLGEALRRPVERRWIERIRPDRCPALGETPAGCAGTDAASAA